MKLLVLGGTVFAGRAVVEEALRRGEDVTIFHRGEHGRDLFPDVERVLGDRRTDLGRLSGRAWDVVVDMCGFQPGDVQASAAAIDAGRYVFVSTAGVYRDWPLEPIADEDAPRHLEGDDYSALKAACERAAEAERPGRVSHVRPGVIVGPHENIGRLPYWLRRIAGGGRVQAPEPRNAPIQLIDARDLAAFCLAAPPGAFNAVAPPGTWTWGELLETIVDVVDPRAELDWTPAEQVLAEVTEPWEERPLWPAPLADMPAVYEVGVGRALEAGLAIRPLRQTVSDTWNWLSAAG